jgi:hypothetical protein
MTDNAASSTLRHSLFDAQNPMDGCVQSVTAGWQTIPQFARAIDRDPRTVNRWINRGLSCAVIYLGRTPYIDPVKARVWFESGMPSPKSPPRSAIRRRA